MKQIIVSTKTHQSIHFRTSETFAHDHSKAEHIAFKAVWLISQHFRGPSRITERDEHVKKAGKKETNGPPHDNTTPNSAKHLLITRNEPKKGHQTVK